MVMDIFMLSANYLKLIRIIHHTNDSKHSFVLTPELPDSVQFNSNEMEFTDKINDAIQ